MLRKGKKERKGRRKIGDDRLDQEKGKIGMREKREEANGNWI